MECIDLSIGRLDALCQDFFKAGNPAIKKPDLIVYIAKGGYLIGCSLQSVFDVPLCGIFAERASNGIKEKLSKLLVLLPGWLCNLLRRIEIYSNFHKKHSDRKVTFDNSWHNIIDLGKIKNILLVDDSIDTGWSMHQVRQVLQEKVPGADIKIFVLNEMSAKKPIVKADFKLYENKILRTPMSKDSSEYKEFVRLYNSRQG